MRRAPDYILELEESTEQREFYAFVEAVEVVGGDARGPGCSVVLRELLERLDVLEPSGRFRPSHLVWLDCVDLEAFNRVPWRHERCDTGNPTDRETRRTQLRELPSEDFVTALVLLSHADAPMIAAFMGAPWHRIVVQTDSGTPIAIGENFEAAIEGPAVFTSLRHLEACVGEQLSPLLNAFSLDFVPDAELGRGDHWENAANAPPWGPWPAGDYSQEDLPDEADVEVPESAVEESDLLDDPAYRRYMKARGRREKRAAAEQGEQDVLPPEFGFFERDQ